MILDRLYTTGLAQVAYLVADEPAGVAAVIDPRRDVAVYLDWAARHRVVITAVLETHIHADFVSGSRELAAAGATVYASRAGDQAFAHEPLDDGDEVAVGSLRLRALWTPGHTPEHLSYLLIDPEQGPEPLALYSGDALFVGDVGRPDLLGAEATERLAGQLFHTVTDRLGRLADDLVVHPGHTGGSACGKKIGAAPETTIGHERRTNYAFQARSKRGFMRMVLDKMPPPPAYYPVLKRVNKSGAALAGTLAPGRPVRPGEVASLIADGALVVDARTPAAYGAGHIPGAVFAGLGPSFTAWMGWLTPYERDIVLVLENEADVDEATLELRRIGLDRLVGYLAGGMPAWRDAGERVATLPQVSVRELAERLDQRALDLSVLDVRDDNEWAEGHIEGALHLYCGAIAQGAEPALEGAGEVAVICGSGYRSSVAASLLEARGLDGLMNVAGGMGAWTEAGLPVVHDRAARPN